MIEVGGYRLEIDTRTTASCNAEHRGHGPDACGCCYCRNWVAGREQVFPPEMLELLSRFGVPVDAEIEVWRVPGDDHPHGYGGWYLLVGSIVHSPDESARKFDLGGWEVSFSPGPSYPVAAFADQVVLEMHFFTWADNYIDDEGLDAD